jgi:hypothetical protein
MKTKPKRPLTVKQKAYIKIKSENPTMSDAKAKRKAGYKESTVRNSLSVCKSVQVKQTIKDALDKAGLNTKAIALKLVEGTEATRKLKIGEQTKFGIKIFKGKEIVDKTQTIKRIVYKDTDDFQTRVKYLDLVTKLTGDQVQSVDHKFPDFDKMMPVSLNPEDEKRISIELGMIKLKITKEV